MMDTNNAQARLAEKLRITDKCPIFRWMRRTDTPSAIVTMLCIVLALSAPGSARAGLQFGDSGDRVVVESTDTEFIPVRGGPSAKAEQIAKLISTDQASYQGTESGWHKIVEPRSKIVGWVDAGKTRIIHRRTVTANDRVKYGGSVYVRESPDVGAPAVGKLEYNSVVRHLETRGDWHQVELPNNVKGWVSGDYSKVIDQNAGEPYEVNVTCVTNPKTIEYLDTGLHVPVTFRLWGPQPPLYLAYLYKYLATCSPNVFRRHKLKGELNEIQMKAWEKDLFPNMVKWDGDEKSKRPQVYGALDDTIRLLKDRYLRNASATEWEFPYPQSLQRIPGRLERIRIGRADLQSLEAPGDAYERIREQALDAMQDVCVGHGYEPTCLTGEKIHSEMTVGKDGTRKAEYFTYVQHYDLEVTVNFPSNYAQSLAEYAIYYLQATFPKSMRGKSAMYRPYFTMGVLADNTLNSSPSCWTFAEYENDRGEGVAQLIGTPDVYGEPVTVYVVEPYISNDRPDIFPLKDYKHPFGIERKVHSQRDIFFSDPPRSGKIDEGHALHVAHIIGGIGSILNWTGFASDVANVYLTTDRYFLNTLLKQNVESARYGFETDALIHNLSYSPTGNQCPDSEDPFIDVLGRDEGAGTGLAQRYTNQLRYLEDHDARELYVLAANHRPQCADNSKRFTSRHYDRLACHDLSCAGEDRNLITVAALNARWDDVMEDTVLPPKDVPVLAAPGVGILSADFEPLWNEQGYRYRCGSSQAAAIVSAAAAKVAVEHRLDGPEIKEQLLGTASPLPFESVVGIVNVERAVRTRPDEYTVWYEDKISSEPLSGRIAEFYGRSPRFPNVPQMSNGYLRERIVAILRAPSDHEGHPQFRILYRTENSKKAKLRISTPLRLDEISVRDGITSRCEISPKANSIDTPCVRVGRSPSDMHVVDLRYVTHIIFPRPRG